MSDGSRLGQLLWDENNIKNKKDRRQKPSDPFGLRWGRR